MAPSMANEQRLKAGDRAQIGGRNGHATPDPSAQALSQTVRACSDQNRIHVVLRGRMGLSEAGAAMKGIVEHPDWRPGMDILLDLCGTRMSFEGYMQMRSVIEIWMADLRRLGTGRNAFFSDNSAVRETARLMSILGKAFSRRDTAVFSSEVDAVAWLDRGRLPAQEDAIQSA